MKRLLPLILLFCLLAHTAVAQPTCSNLPLLHYIGDTLAYIQLSFISEKDRYVGKPLRVLLRDIGIPVRSYLIEPDWNDIKHFTHVSLSFYSPNELNRRIAENKEPLIIHLEFEPKLSQDSAIALLRKSHEEWLSAETQFYNGVIIKQMLLTNYTRHQATIPLLRVDTTGYVHVPFRPLMLMGGPAGSVSDTMASVTYPASIDSFIDQLHNEKAMFKLVLVMDKVIYFDAGGKPTGNLLEPMSLDLATVKKHYPMLLLISKLVQRLDDEERDYYADLLLYSLVGVCRAAPMSFCSREKWLGRNPDNGLSYKKTDIRMWRDYLDGLYWGIERGSIF